VRGHEVGGQKSAATRLAEASPTKTTSLE
jgi:hypothetical protein